MNFNLINYAIGTTAFAGIQNNLTSAANPLPINDSSQGYTSGSIWINTVANTIYIATSVGVGAASWVLTTGGGGGTIIQNNFTATVNPSLTSNLAAGYSVGSHWINVTTNKVFVCVDSTNVAPIWEEVTNQTNAKINAAAIINPTPADNTTLGYTTGSLWINATTSSVWMATSSNLTAAVWSELTNSATPITNPIATTNPLATSDSANTDGTGVYSVGSSWINTVSDTAYVCVDAAPTAAVWIRITQSTSNLSAIVNPIATDDATLRYEIGSFWVNTNTSDVFLCVDATPANAVWSLISETVKNFYNATLAPLATDDIVAGYDIGSVWVDSATSNAYICTSNLAANAVWIEITKPIQHNFIATVPPAVGNDILQGYIIGSQWIDTVADVFYVCSDNTAGAAFWVNVSFPTSGLSQLVNNYTAVTNPSPADNLTNGYGVGSFWYNTSSVNLYVCITSTDVASTWISISGGGSGGGTVVSVNAKTGVVVLTAADVGAEPTLGNPVATGMILSSSVAGTRSWVTAPSKNNGAAAADPVLTDDSSAAGGLYSVGSLWVNTLTDNAFICVDSTVGSAIWTPISSSASNTFGTTAPTPAMTPAAGYGFGSIYVNTINEFAYISISTVAGVSKFIGISESPNNTALVDPTVTDDMSGAVGAVYNVGSIWINTLTNSVFLCTSASIGSAVWVSIDGNAKTNLAAASPTVTDDLSLGYKTGSLWTNSVDSNLFICTQSSLASATWVQITSTSAAVNNLAAIIPPTVANDITQGYTPSSHWYDTTSQNLYINTSNSAGAAVWVLVSDTKVNNYAATIAPTATDDSTAAGGYYELGSVWYIASSSELYICVNPAAAAAKWLLLTNIKSNDTALVDPTAVDDSTLGYGVGSTWVNTVFNRSYICTNATAAAAVWMPISNSIHALANTIPPTTTDDESLGFSTGSIWFDTISGDLYMCTSPTATAAAWVKISDATKNNMVATVNPVGSNDITQGYVAGSIWAVPASLNKDIFMCIDNSFGVAVWVNISSPVIPAAEVIQIMTLTFPSVATTTTTSLGATAAVFNASNVQVYLNGVLQLKGTEVNWFSANSFKMQTVMDKWDVLTIQG